MFIIAVGGEKQHGKDTIARYLAETYNFWTLSFARPVKEICAIITGDPVEYFDDEEKKNEIIEWLGITRRELMQFVGTEAFQDSLMDFKPILKTKVGRKIWCMKLGQKVIELQKSDAFHPRLFTMADNRFPHEQEFLIETYGRENILFLKVFNPRVARTETSGHRSETQVAQVIWDETIVNDGTFEDLYKNVRRVLVERNLFDRFQEES